MKRKAERNGVKGTVGSRGHKIFADFAFWDFCRQVRAVTGPLWRSDRLQAGPLAT